MQSSPSPSNDWHYVNISRQAGGGGNSFTWKNKAGVGWELTFIPEESTGVLKFKVTEICLFNNEEQGFEKKEKKTKIRHKQTNLRNKQTKLK